MPKNIPISAARSFAETHVLRQVIICAWDGKNTHVVTYGKSIEDCDQAALGGDKIKAALGWPEDVNCVPSRVKALRSSLTTLLDYFSSWRGHKADDVAELTVRVRHGDLVEAERLVGR